MGIAACPGVVSLQIGPLSAGRAEERWRAMTYAISGAGTDGPRPEMGTYMGSLEEMGGSGPDAALGTVPGKEPPLFWYGLGPAVGSSSEGKALGILVGMEGHRPSMALTVANSTLG